MSTAFVAVLMPALLVLAGLAIDAGQLLVAHRQTQALADGAARAGAGQLDLAAVRAAPGGAVALEPSAAIAAAKAYVEDVAPRAEAAVMDVAPSHIVVRVTSRPVEVTLLRLAGVGPTVRVQASGRAEPRIGITEAGQ